MAKADRTGKRKRRESAARRVPDVIKDILEKGNK